MEGLQLFDLCENHLEKVFRKVDSKSFRRLQQTSGETWEFIQNNSKVSVFTEGTFSLYAIPPGHRTGTSDSFKIYKKLKKIANPNGLYASRLASLEIHDVNWWLYQDLCDFVKKCRITCDELILWDMKWQTQHYAGLLEVLKPVSVRQVSGAVDLFEGIVLSPILKNVTVDVFFHCAETAAKKFLATCQNVIIWVSQARGEGAREISAQLELFKIILQLLFSEARPHLKQFTFVLSIAPRELPSVEKLTDELSNFNVKEARGTSIDAHVNLNLPPEHYPEGSRCELTLKRPRVILVNQKLEYGKIYFERG